MEPPKYSGRFSYDIVYGTNVDVHTNGNRLFNYTTFISGGHDEYWSSTIRDAIENARAGQVNLAFFGANASYWQVRYEPGKDGTPNRTMVTYKDSCGKDPMVDPKLITCLYRSPQVNRPEQTLLGLQFSGSSRFYTPTTFTDYVVKNSNYWAYQGSGLVDGQKVPKIIGYEIDSVFPSAELQPIAAEFTVLAESPYVDGDGTKLTQKSVIYRTQQDSWVFSSGTMAWSWALDNDIQEYDFFGDRRSVPIQIVTKNILDRFKETSSPSVSISAPSNGSSVSGANVSVTAVASDNDQVAGVQFKLDGANLGNEDTSAPFAINWDTRAVANGNHNLTAVARDNAGNTKESAVISVNVKNVITMPDLVVTSLSYANGIFTSTIKNQGSAAIPAGVWIDVDYLVDGIEKADDNFNGPLAVGASITIGTTSAPYKIPQGNHIIAADVDDDNLLVESDETNNQLTQNIKVGGSDTVPPTVTINAPVGGSTVSGSAVTITASANDNVGVTEVSFKLDGVSLGTADTSAPYSFTWNTTTVAEGNHTLTATALDADGNSTTSAPVVVNVHNAAAVLLPDVIVTNLVYSNGIFTSTIKNQGNKTTPAGVSIGVSYFVDGSYKTYGSYYGTLAAGASVTIGTTSSAYNIPNGTHTIAALVDDNNLFAELDETNNELSKSIVINVADTVLPTVAITNPSNGAVLPRSIQTINATANDSIGVASVQFKLDGANLGAKDTVAPFAVTFNTTNFTNGAHTISSVVQDIAGNTASSNNVAVTIDNSIISALPDVVVTSLSYNNGIFTSVVKNQGTSSTPAGVSIGVSYFVNGAYKTYGSYYNSLAAGASVTIGTNGPAYIVPNGTFTLSAEADDNNRFAELDETNNKLSKQITVP